MSIRALSVAITIAALWWSTSSFGVGLGLGEVNVASSLSAPFKASITLKGMDAINLVVHAENKVMFSRSTIDFGKAQPAGNGPVLSKGCNAVQNRLCCGPSGAAVWGRLGVAFLAKGRAINCETRLDSPPHSHSERYLIFRMDH